MELKQTSEYFWEILPEMNDHPPQIYFRKILQALIDALIKE